MSELRNKRVEELLVHEIGNLIVSGNIKDPRVSTFLSVTRVEAAKDYSQAKVYISTFEEKTILESGVSGLNSAAGFIQSALAKRIKLRLTPKLVFIVDSGIKEGFELMKKIDTLTGHEQG